MTHRVTRDRMLSRQSQQGVMNRCWNDKDRNRTKGQGVRRQKMEQVVREMEDGRWEQGSGRGQRTEG